MKRRFSSGSRSLTKNSSGRSVDWVAAPESWSTTVSPPSPPTYSRSLNQQTSVTTECPVKGRSRTRLTWPLKIPGSENFFGRKVRPGFIMIRPYINRQKTPTKSSSGVIAQQRLRRNSSLPDNLPSSSLTATRDCFWSVLVSIPACSPVSTAASIFARRRCSVFS